MRHLIELGLTSKRQHANLLGPWLIPYRHTKLLLKLPLAAVRESFDELMRDGNPRRLELEQRYWDWRRRWGLVLFTRPDGVGRYSPVATLRLAARGTATAVEITVIAPSFLLMLAFFVAVAMIPQIA